TTESLPQTMPQPVAVTRTSNEPSPTLREHEDPADSGPAKEAKSSPVASASAPESASRAISLGPTAIAAIGLGLWLLGAAFMGLRLCVGHIGMRRLRSSAAPAEAAAQSLCQEVARQMNVAAPSVWRSPFLFSPCLDGLRACLGIH